MDTNKLIPLLPDMAAYVAVVETGSFTRAAEKLGITPSGVSRQVSRLEKALSAVLIERTTRRQTTTQLGREVYEQCRNMLDSAREAVSATESEATEVRGRLRIAVPKAFARQVLEPHLRQFMRRYPAISLHLQVTDQRLDPGYHDVDIVFVVAAEPLGHLVSKNIGPVRSVLCASPDYLQRRGWPQQPVDLMAHDCIPLGLFEQDNHWLLTQGERKEKISVDGRYLNNHSEMRLLAVKDGFGIGIFPDFVVRNALSEGDVVEVLPDWTLHSDFQGGVYMQYLPMRFMPGKIRAFIDFIVDLDLLV
ncbi:LysR family transcriptional regulator [Oceanospirillum linum]|uniref:LysR family transcriptional regulator n=1 Tax=Oceanospirillum linum TaxID=966 RepID=A0A1T1HA93_OCELI|nr:LysR family transcriptional regulator [Oceanospirillum linum]OOV86647.1 LysR family transcriptional regulator [Oceanospirillum linum]SEG27403.1 DNA-binding transcriptional regulator, LysR family [Oleiphilus messinensis]SMP27445.1 DNA-binding transcriptional regulator, LysR family [Oceanospirillum linum]